MLAGTFVETPHQSSALTMSVLSISAIKTLKLIFRVSKNFD